MDFTHFSLISEEAKLYILYTIHGVPDVTVTRVDKDDLTKKAKNTAFMKQWLRLAASSKVRMRWRPEKLQDRQYFSRDKLTAKLLLCYRIGELNFKTNRKGEATAKTGSTLCLGRVCGGEDSLAHVMECETYDTRYSGVDSEWALADYLVKLYIQRNKKYGENRRNIDQNNGLYSTLL